MFGPFVGVIGASIFAVLFLALVLGIAAGSLFFGIFYCFHRLGKAASRAFPEPGA